MGRKSRKTHRSPLSNDEPTQGTEQKNVEDDKVERLSRSWIKVANESAQHGVELTKELIGDCTQEICQSFWELVQKEYSSFAPRAHTMTFDELYNQWKTILPDLTGFLKTFTHLWKDYKLSGQDAEARCEQAFTAVQGAFRATHGHDFEYEVTSRLLIHHAQWRTVLKPLLMPGNDEDEAENEPSALKEDQESLNEPPTPENVSSTPQDDEAENEKSTLIDEGIHDNSLTRKNELAEHADLSEEITEANEFVVGVTRPRAELERDDEDDASRHVRQRLGTTTQEVSPLIPTIDSQLGESIDAKKLEVLERQLEWNIMTRSEDNLSPEALEYLRFQRAQILSKMRKQTQAQQ